MFMTRRASAASPATIAELAAEAARNGAAGIISNYGPCICCRLPLESPGRLGQADHRRHLNV